MASSKTPLPFWLQGPETPFATDRLRQFGERWLNAADETSVENIENYLAAHPERVLELRRVLIGSEFLSQHWQRHPKELLTVLCEDALQVSVDYLQQLRASLLAVDDDVHYDRCLRQFRNRAISRIIWRDLNRLADMEATIADLSSLARACIQSCLDYHYAQLSQRWGLPVNSEGKVQPMLVIGMGKLGAGELNLSSDIDLIFAYPESGETQHGEDEAAKKTTSNQEFFSHLGRAIIKSLDATTAEGFVFRVDMRLRPYGQSGALVSNFPALEDYYQNQGREWERYAMVKARVVASNGSEEHTNILMDLLRSFTFRRYLDYSAIAALRHLKQLINRELQRRSMANNIKLGKGGIREVEFIVQAFQLIRGGRETELQDNRLLVILSRLQAHNYLPKEAVEDLRQAYVFLRNTEHAIQAYQDRQTQELPHDEVGCQRLAWIMGFQTWEDFIQALDQHRQQVNEQFQAMVQDPEEEQSTTLPDLPLWQSLWESTFEKEAVVELLSQHQYEDPQRVWSLLNGLRESKSVLAMDAIGRQRLDKFIPHLLAHLNEVADPTVILARIIKLVSSVARRSAYLVLLMENPQTLQQLVKLSMASPWIADRLAEHPALLDELLDPSSLYTPPLKEELRDELRRSILRISPDDLEEQMEALRYFRSSHSLRVAACEVTDTLPLMKVSDYLTWIAEVILDYVLQLAWQQMVERHGYPDGKVREEPVFIILGYGKLGGIELGHNSDLDLVFIHDADPNGVSDGERSIDNLTFYTRLGQKIIHILNTRTPSGQLYEVDMRLRPSGQSGLLVSTFKAFEKYQRENAWTWEHQALVRARVVSGCEELSERFNQLRANILQQQRGESELKQAVIDMRQKMRDHLGTGAESKNSAADAFHLKQDAGGIVDIEFMVQYAVLAWAHTEPTLVKYTDNIRILETIEQVGSPQGLLDAQEAVQLIEAYKAFRSMGHRLALQQASSVVDGHQLTAERQIVQRIWQRLLEHP